MTRLVIRVKDKDIGLLRRLARFHKMSADHICEEVVESWLAEVRAVKAGSVPLLTFPRSSSSTVTSVGKSPKRTATRVTIRFAEDA